MADYNFDFNGDSLLPEQDNLFDDLLDDLAFQTEIANYDTTFLGKDRPAYESSNRPKTHQFLSIPLQTSTLVEAYWIFQMAVVEYLVSIYVLVKSPYCVLDGICLGNVVACR
jgi:hypothetical protein